MLAELTAPTPGAWAGIAGIAAMFLLPRFLAREDPPRPLPRVPRPRVSIDWRAGREPEVRPWTPGRAPEGRLRGGSGWSRPALDGKPPDRMPVPRGGLSEDYQRYISGGLPPISAEALAVWDGIVWPERMALFLSQHRRTRGGLCEDGRTCQGQSQARQGHHVNYSELFRETRRTVKLVCRPCHVELEKVKRRAVR
jgi:hypothetical protein